MSCTKSLGVEIGECLAISYMHLGGYTYGSVGFRSFALLHFCAPLCDGLLFWLDGCGDLLWEGRGGSMENSGIRGGFVFPVLCCAVLDISHRKGIGPLVILPPRQWLPEGQRSVITWNWNVVVSGAVQ